MPNNAFERSVTRGRKRAAGAARHHAPAARSRRHRAALMRGVRRTPGTCGKVGTTQAANVEKLVPKADRRNFENLLQRSRKALIKRAWIRRLAASVRSQPLRSGAFEFPRSAVWAGVVPCLITGSGGRLTTRSSGRPAAAAELER